MSCGQPFSGRPNGHPGVDFPQGEFIISVSKVLNSSCWQPTPDWPSGWSGAGHLQVERQGLEGDSIVHSKNVTPSKRQNQSAQPIWKFSLFLLSQCQFLSLLLVKGFKKCLVFKLPLVCTLMSVQQQSRSSHSCKIWLIDFEMSSWRCLAMALPWHSEKQNTIIGKFFHADFWKLFHLIKVPMGCSESHLASIILPLSPFCTQQPLQSLILYGQLWK